MQSIPELLSSVPLFAGLPDDQLELLAACAVNDGFADGEALLREGEPDESFYVIRHGVAALQTRSPTGPLVIETLHEHDVVGWSWLVPPYLSHFDVVARGDVRVVRFDAVCLRGKFADDAELARAMYERFVVVIAERLQATRLRLLDIYGAPRAV